MTRFPLNHPIVWTIFALSGISMAAPSTFAQGSIIERVQKHQDSIVSIQAQSIKLNPDNKAGTAVAEQSGAGIIIDPSGYIVTNTHIILYAQYIYVTLNNGTRLPASISLIAPDSDFTILKVSAPVPLKAMPWADSDGIRLGDPIISVGNSALLKQTISGGMIKGIGQKQSGSQNIVELIETDLNLYQGDSGGPILDQDGNFLGIIAAKNMKVERSSFAIPSNKIRLQFLNHLNGAKK